MLIIKIIKTIIIKKNKQDKRNKKAKQKVIKSKETIKRNNTKMIFIYWF